MWLVVAGMAIIQAARHRVLTEEVKSESTWGVLLIEAPSDVQASVIALSTQVKANFIWAVLALVSVPLDGIEPTRVTAHPARIRVHSFLENRSKRTR